MKESQTEGKQNGMQVERMKGRRKKEEDMEKVGATRGKKSNENSEKLRKEYREKRRKEEWRERRRR